MNMLKRIAALMSAIALFATAVAGSQAATSDTATVQITTQPGAGLSASITGTNFGTSTYSFVNSPQLTGQLNVKALDTRGTAAGWNIVLSATDFTGSTTGRTFAIGQLSLGAGTVSTISGPSSGQTTSALSPVSTSPTKIWSAGIGSGDGSYSNNVPATLVVPGGTLVDTYTSTITVAITSGP